MKPVADYLLRLAEVLALAALFHAAARQTDHFLLDLMSWILTLLVGFYAGLGGSFIFRAIGKFETKSWKVALLVALPPATLLAWVALELGRVMTDAIRLMSAVGT